MCRHIVSCSAAQLCVNSSANGSYDELSWLPQYRIWASWQATALALLLAHTTSQNTLITVGSPTQFRTPLNSTPKQCCTGPHATASLRTSHSSRPSAQQIDNNSESYGPLPTPCRQAGLPPGHVICLTLAWNGLKGLAIKSNTSIDWVCNVLLKLYHDTLITAPLSAK
jgi:hypothetical protein